MTRPIGVTIIAILVALRGLLAIIGGLGFLGDSLGFLTGGFYANAAMAGFWSALVILVGLALLAIAGGLWALNEGALKWLAGLLIVMLIVDLLFGFINQSFNWLGIGFTIVILVYLFASGTQKAFAES